MKRIRNIFTLSLLSLSLFNIGAQEFEAKLDEARSSYKGGNLDDTRFALQQALDAVNTEIGKEILAILPQKMGPMSSSEADDNVSGSNAGYAGVYVNREYKGSETQSSSIELISDSPLISGINTILALPTMMAGSDPNQKRIKVDGYKSLMQKNETSEGAVSYDIQIPFGSSLLTFHVSGVNSENEVIAMANTIPVSTIAKLAQ